MSTLTVRWGKSFGSPWCSQLDHRAHTAWNLCGSRKLVLLVASIEKWIFSVFINLVQGPFMFLCLLLFPVDKISSCIEWGEVYLGHASCPYISRRLKWLNCLLVQYLGSCRGHKDVGGHGADRVEEEQCSASTHQGSWKSLVLCYWGQYLVVVKWLGSDCSHISRSLGVTLEVNLMSQTNSL